MWNHLDVVLEYTPILLILLYGMSEVHCYNQHKIILCRTLFILLLWCFFYILVHKFGIDKDIAFIATCIGWVISTYFRRNYINMKFMEN